MQTNLLSHHYAYRLNEGFPSFARFLSSLGPIYLQARGMGGGFGKAVPRLDLLSIDGMEFAVDPEQGLALSLEEWVGIHAGVTKDSGGEFAALDFEFSSFPAGLSLIEIPGISPGGKIQEFVSNCRASEISKYELETWRSEFLVERPICGCCEKRAQFRSENVDAHPLYFILCHAAENGIELECNLNSSHAELCGAFVPNQVIAGDNGFISAVNAECDSALHIDMRYVHALAMKTGLRDGMRVSFLEIFDMHGKRNFEFVCEMPEIYRTWRILCDQR